jgi:hypothetical protein
MKVTPEQNIRFMARDVLTVLNTVCAGFTYDPGHSDLDDEQPIHVRMTLGDYRAAVRLKRELDKVS